MLRVFEERVTGKVEEQPLLRQSLEVILVKGNAGGNAGVKG